MLAAREAMLLVRRLRYRTARSQLQWPATAAAVVLEWALAQERPGAVSFTPEEAREVLLAAGPGSTHALYRALRQYVGQR